MLKITRSNDSRVVKSILHRIADIPGGVTVSIATLGGASLVEGTPIGAQDGSTGLCKVVKTAKVVTIANASAVTYEVAKGHHFKVGDFFTINSNNGKAITVIDKTTNADKDVITVGTTLGAAVAVGDIAYEVTGANTTLAVNPVAIVGSNYDVLAGEQIFVDAWLFAVVREANFSFGITAAIKTALKGIIFI
jgi:hypothetical protein